MVFSHLNNCARVWLKFWHRFFNGLCTFRHSLYFNFFLFLMYFQYKIRDESDLSNWFVSIILLRSITLFAWHIIDLFRIWKKIPRFAWGRTTWCPLYWYNSHVTINYVVVGKTEHKSFDIRSAPSCFNMMMWPWVGCYISRKYLVVFKIYP